MDQLQSWKLSEQAAANLMHVLSAGAIRSLCTGYDLLKQQHLANISSFKCHLSHHSLVFVVYLNYFKGQQRYIDESENSWEN